MKTQSLPKLFTYLVLCCALVFAVGVISGCSNSGSAGLPGAAGPTKGTVAGTVTSATGTAPIAGAVVSSNPSAGTATTDSSGNYTLNLPSGSYQITFTCANYTTGTALVNVAIGVTTPLNATMAEAAGGKPTVTLAASGQNVGYSTSFSLTATASDPNGDSLSYSWSGVTSGTGTSATATTPSLTTALAGVAAPASDPGGYVSAYVQENRMGVLPLSADTRGSKAVTVTVNDGRGQTNSASVTVYAAGVQPGVKTVALGVPVYLNSGTTNTTTWNVTGPASSPTYSVATALATGRNPFFTPDAQGKYVVSTGTGSTLNIYAGKFVGVISGGSYVSKTVTQADGMWYGWAPSSTQSSFTYTNWPVVQTDPGCQVCHNNGTAPDMFTPWKATAHATFFSRGLENITSNSNSCTTCHTTGYDVAATAANGGYDDMAAVEGFVYNKQVGSWAAMVNSAPLTARRSNIQCENCHGPQDTGATSAHDTGSSATGTASVRVNYSAEVCAVCHSSGTGHHLYSEWSTTNPDTGFGHSKIAQLDATGYAGHAQSTSTSCSRCHTAQGFVAYVNNNLVSGNAGTLAASLITWTKDNALPQTCTACHDPHVDDDAHPNHLRVFDTVSSTMAGFGVNGVGKGALCMVCHNNRNGIQCASAPTGTGLCVSSLLDPTGKTFLHEDTDAYAPLINDTMHDASQTEVLMGRDFFFMGNSLPMPSKHVAVEDTCVGCHMALNPQTHLSHGTPAVSSHTFYIRDQDRATLCANCHSSSVDGEALATFVEDQLTALGKAMSTNLLTRTMGQTIYANKQAITVGAGTTLTYNDGSFYFNGATSTSGTNPAGALSKITTDAAGTNPVFGPNDRLKKASWNWTMIERDGSKGIHNPTLVTSVLANTMAAMNVMAP